ncbi:MAG: hypothetical protein ACFNVX_05905 [Lachnoanaerobaculum saburreum]
MNNKAAKISVFIFFCIFSLNICINSFALTPPSNDVLINALSKNGEPTQSIVDNTELFFVYNAVPVSKIKSEDELRELVFESNTDIIDIKDSSWVVTEYQPSNEYFERILSYDKNGKLFESANLIYEDKNYTTITLMSDLLGEQYNTGIKNILLLGQDRTTPFGSYLLVKVFDDNSLKIGVLVDIKRDKISIKKGWYTFDEIKKFIALYNSDKFTVNSIILSAWVIVAVLSVGFIVCEKYWKSL